MAEKLTPYDPAEDLLTDEAVAIFMADAFETEDSNYIAHALGIVARAKGMTQIAKETGLSREQLYRSFSPHGNPTLKSTLAVMKALGIAFAAKIVPAQRRARKKPAARKPPVAPKRSPAYQRATKRARPASKS